MKQLKVFIHPDRATDLLHALGEAGLRRISLFDAKGVSRAPSPKCRK